LKTESFSYGHPVDPNSEYDKDKSPKPAEDVVGRSDRIKYPTVLDEGMTVGDVVSWVLIEAVLLELID
jgi:hypothetical protein